MTGNDSTFVEPASVAPAPSRRRPTKEQTAQLLAALEKLGRQRITVDSSEEAVVPYPNMGKEKKKRKEKKVKKVKKEKKEKKESIPSSSDEDDDFDDILAAVAATRGWDSADFLLGCPALDESIVGHTLLYVQKDGFHLYQVTQFFSTSTKNFNVEVEMLFGEDRGKKLDYALVDTAFSSSPSEVGDWAVVIQA